ncbi:helix-turn-helix transcriptional regulator [bacterium]|nr:helix-turn-helix transcriptional regulator [bacterium]
MDYTLDILKNRIREARISANLNQEELASKLKMTGTQTISRYENGTRCPNIETMIHISNVTGRELSWFFSTDEEFKTTSEEKRLIAMFRTLNESGKQHIFECVENAVASKRY